MKARPIICFILFMLLSIELVCLNFHKTSWHKDNKNHKDQNQLWKKFISVNRFNKINQNCDTYPNLRTSIIQVGYQYTQNQLEIIQQYQNTGQLYERTDPNLPPVNIFQSVYIQSCSTGKQGTSGIQIWKIKNKNYILSITFDNGLQSWPFGLACVYPKSKYAEPTNMYPWFQEDSDWADKYSNQTSSLSTNCILLNNRGVQKANFKQSMSASINGFKLTCSMEYGQQPVEYSFKNCAALRLSCLILNS